MWYRNGNCYVHLYAKGESQKGPAFRVPFACLLDARCQPLVERFVDRSISETEALQKGRVDLYIPAPWTANQLQALHFHLAIRNLFAWVFRRSMVGEQLGTALIALASSLERFRQPEADNTQDLLAYLDEEGYLDLRDQPTYALAILRLAENFQMSDLYHESFAHCVGMSERLFKHSEYSVSADPLFQSHDTPSSWWPIPSKLTSSLAHQPCIAKAYPTCKGRHGLSPQSRWHDAKRPFTRGIIGSPSRTVGRSPITSRSI